MYSWIGYKIFKDFCKKFQNYLSRKKKVFDQWETEKFFLTGKIIKLKNNIKFKEVEGFFAKKIVAILQRVMITTSSCWAKRKK